MKVFDVKFEDDLVYKNGDFLVAESTAQHIEHLLIASKGEYKYAFSVGAEIRKGLSEDGSLLGLQGDIQETLEQDGLQVKNLKIGKIIDVEAEYK